MSHPPTRFRSLLALAACGLAACGGDKNSSGPSNPFPDAAGTYQVEGGFDGFTRQDASFSGTLTLTQASRASGTLGGSASFVALVGGQSFDVADDAIESATVSESGAIAFTLGSGTSTGAWTFTGDLLGGTITGRHTLSDGSQSTSGDWTGTRTPAGASAAGTRAGARGLDGLVRRLGVR